MWLGNKVKFRQHLPLWSTPTQSNISDPGYIYLFKVTLISRSGYTTMGGKQMTLYG